MRVLIVDDDRSFQEAVAALLATLHEVDLVGAASDGEQAVRQAKELRPDVIVMDIEMPNVDGVDATRLIQAELPDTRVVVLSGSDVEAHVLGMKTAGATAYIRKENFALDLPVVLEALRER